MQSPGPISLLAKYLRGLANTGSNEPHPIRIPQSIHIALKDRLQNAPPSHEVFEKAEIEDLVDSLGDNLERWCSLEESSFAAIAMAFIFTEKCMAREEGVFKLYIALESMKNGLGSLRRTAYKNIVGEKLMQTLITFFLDNRRQALARRWAGLLLVELLETVENRNLLQTICDGEGNTYLLQIGKMVVEGKYRIPKHICGSLISELAMDATMNDRRELLLTVMPKDAFDIKPFGDGERFPIGTGTQWELDFTNYLLDLEIAREQKNLRIPMCFTANAVKINDSYIGKADGVICDMSDILTLRIPTDSELSHHRWVDIDLANIQAVVATPLDSDATNLTLCLCDYKEMDYLFLLDMKPVKEPDTVIIQVRTDEAELIRNDLMSAKVYRREKWNKKAGKQSLARSWVVIGGNAIPTSSIPAGYKFQQEARDVRQRREDLENDVASPPPADTFTPAFSQGKEYALQDLLEVMGELHDSHSHLSARHINVQHSATQSQERIQSELHVSQNTPSPVQPYSSVSIASETQEKDTALYEPVVNTTQFSDQRKLFNPEESVQRVPEENLGSNESVPFGKHVEHVEKKAEQSRLQPESKRSTNYPKTMLENPDKPKPQPQPQPQTLAFKPLTLKTHPLPKSKIQKKGDSKPDRVNDDPPFHPPEIVITKDIYDFASDDEPIKDLSKTTGKRKVATRGNKKAPGPRKKPKIAPKPKPKAAPKKSKKKTEFKPAERVIDDSDDDEGPPPRLAPALKLTRKAPIKSRVVMKPAAQVKGGLGNGDAHFPRSAPMTARKTPTTVKAAVMDEPGDDNRPSAPKKKVIQTAGAVADVSNPKTAASKGTTHSKPALKGKGKPTVPAKRPVSPEYNDDNVQPPQKKGTVPTLRRSARFKDASPKNFKIDSDSEIEDSQSSLAFPSPKAQTTNWEKNVANPQLISPPGEGVSNISSPVPQSVSKALAPEVPVKQQNAGVAKVKPVPPHWEDSPMAKTNAPVPALKDSILEVASKQKPGEGSPMADIPLLVPSLVCPPTPEIQKQAPSSSKIHPDCSVKDAPIDDALPPINSPNSEPPNPVPEKKSIPRKTQLGSIIQKAIAMTERGFSPAFTFDLSSAATEFDENEAQLPETDFMVCPDLSNVIIKEKHQSTESTAVSEETPLQQAIVEGGANFHEPLVQNPGHDIKAATGVSDGRKFTEKEAQIIVLVDIITSGTGADVEPVEETKHGPKPGTPRESNALDTGKVISESLDPSEKIATASAEMSTKSVTTAIVSTESKMLSSPEVGNSVVGLPTGDVKLSKETPSKHVPETDNGNRRSGQSAAKTQKTELNNPMTPATRAPHIVPLSASKLTPFHEPIDESLTRKPQIIEWGSDGPKNQGRLVPKTSATQKQLLYQVGIQPEQSDNLPCVRAEYYQLPDAPGVNEVSVNPFAVYPHIPSPRKQPEEEELYVRETGLTRKIHVPPGIENDEESHTKLESLNSESAEEAVDPSDDEDLYSRLEPLQPQGEGEEFEDSSPAAAPKQPIRSTFIIAGDDEDYFFGNIPHKESLSNNGVGEKLAGSQIRSLLPLRRRTVESTGSPLPKLLSSQKDMEEANDQKTKSLKPSVLNFAFTKRERSPSSSSSVAQSPKPDQPPSGVGDSVDMPIVLEESSSEPPETQLPAKSVTPLARNFIPTPARTVITSDIYTPFKITHAALNTVSSGRSTQRKVRFNDMLDLPEVLTPCFGPKPVPEYAQNIQKLRSTLVLEPACVKKQKQKPHIEHATAKVPENKLSTKSNSIHAQSQLVPPSKENIVASKGIAGRNMSDEVWEILNSSQEHLLRLQKQESKVRQSVMECGTPNYKQSIHGTKTNSSSTGRFFMSVEANGIFGRAKEQKQEPSKREDGGNLGNPGKASDNNDGHENDHAEESSDEDSDSSDDSDDDHISNFDEEEDDWRASLPDYHKETLSILEKISKHWIYYLMSSEERIEQTLKDYETRADKVIVLLQETHFGEYCQFLKRLKDTRERVQGICHETREKVKAMVPEDLNLGVIERDLKRKNEDLVQGIEDTISMLMGKI